MTGSDVTGENGVFEREVGEKRPIFDLRPESIAAGESPIRSVTLHREAVSPRRGICAGWNASEFEEFVSLNPGERDDFDRQGMSLDATGAIALGEYLVAAGMRLAKREAGRERCSER